MELISEIQHGPAQLRSSSVLRYASISKFSVAFNDWYQYAAIGQSSLWAPLPLKCNGNGAEYKDKQL